MTLPRSNGFEDVDFPDPTRVCRCHGVGSNRCRALEPAAAASGELRGLVAEVVLRDSGRARHRPVGLRSARTKSRASGRGSIPGTKQVADDGSDGHFLSGDRGV